jgi:type IV pilus assembly protein PilX
MIVVLMLMLAITGIALFSAKYAGISEASARNQLDIEVARQAAESALRDAERDLLISDGTVLLPGARCPRSASRPVEQAISSFTPACIQGQCSKDLASYSVSTWTGAAASPTAEPWWPDRSGGLWNSLAVKPKVGSPPACNFSGGVPIGTFTGGAQIKGVSQQPEYLIEQFIRGGGRIVYYRITARGFGLSNQTEAVLQSYFQPFTVN